jgi:hypothetical protein
MHLIAITNPVHESAYAEFTHNQSTPITLESIVPKYGDKIENGAQIVIVSDDPTPRVWQYIAERNGDYIWIRTNNNLSDYIDTEDIGPSVAEGTVTPAEPEAELETYTVFGEDDDGERFRAVVAASSPAAAYVAGIQAGLVDEGFEHDVAIAAVLKGDVTDIDVTPNPVEEN